MSDLQSKLQKAQEENSYLKLQLQKAKEEKEDTTLIESSANIEAVPRLVLKPRRILKGHLSKISSIHWSRDSKRLVSTSQDGKLIVWNAFTMHKLHLVTLRVPWVMTCAFSQGGHHVACGGLHNKCAVYSLNTKSQTPKCELIGHEGYVSCTRFVENKKMVTSSGDSTCKYWDLETVKAVKTFSGHKSDVMSVDVSLQNSNLFTSAGCDRIVKLWDIRVESCVQSFAGHSADVNTVKFFPTGQCIGSGSDDGSCRLFDIRADRELMQYESDKIMCGVTSIDFSSSGRFLFAAYETINCIIWDVLKGKRLALLNGHDSRVSSIGMTADGMALATASWDATIKVWA